ncbi:hypothetical protein LMH73_006240 [Vibrio splendidus]|nr:hypothetical protein [Vibrio splendidus]MCC4880752.1 hypothetical protein [Vibrio splendidus]
MITHTLDLLRSIHAVNSASKASLKEPSEMSVFHRNSLKTLDELGLDFNDLYTLKNRGIAYALQNNLLQYVYHHGGKPVYWGIEDGLKYYFHTPTEMTTDNRVDYIDEKHKHFSENHSNATFTGVPLTAAIHNLQNLTTDNNSIESANNRLDALKDLAPKPITSKGAGSHNINAVNQRAIKVFKYQGFEFSHLLEENELDANDFVPDIGKPGLYGQLRMGVARTRKLGY